MTTIGEVHDFIRELLNQGQAGYFSPEDIDRAFNTGGADKFNSEKQQFEATQKISGDLAFFKTSDVITLTSGAGSLPDGYDYALNASTTGNRQVDIVPESEWVTRINDPISVPNESYPIMAIRTDVRVIPSTLTEVSLYYLRFPENAIFVYSEDVDGNITPNPGASTDPDWPSSCFPDLILRAISYLGVALSDDQMIKLKSFKAQTEGV